MHIEFRHLRTIKAIHDTGGLSHAADQLNITQSALSHQWQIGPDAYRDRMPCLF